MVTKTGMDKVYDKDFIDRLRKGPDSDIETLIRAILAQTSTSQQSYPSYFQREFIILVQERYETSKISFTHTLQVYAVFIAVWMKDPVLDLTITTSDGTVQASRMSLMMESVEFRSLCANKAKAITVNYTSEEMRLLMTPDVASLDTKSLVKFVDIAEKTESKNRMDKATNELQRKLDVVPEGKDQNALWQAMSESSHPIVRGLLCDAVAKVLNDQPNRGLALIKTDTYHGFAISICDLRTMFEDDYRIRFAQLFLIALSISVFSEIDYAYFLALPTEVQQRIKLVLCDDSILFGKSKDKYMELYLKLSIFCPSIRLLVDDRSRHYGIGQNPSLQKLQPAPDLITAGSYKTDPLYRILDTMKEKVRRLPYSATLEERVFSQALVVRYVQSGHFAKLMDSILDIEPNNCRYPDAFQVAMMVAMRGSWSSHDPRVSLALYLKFGTAYLRSLSDLTLLDRTGAEVKVHALPFFFAASWFQTNYREGQPLQLDLSSVAIHYMTELFRRHLIEEPKSTTLTLAELNALFVQWKVYEVSAELRAILFEKWVNLFYNNTFPQEKEAYWAVFTVAATTAERSQVLSHMDTYKAMGLQQPKLEGCKLAVPGTNLLFLAASDIPEHRILSSEIDTLNLSSTQNLGAGCSFCSEGFCPIP